MRITPFNLQEEMEEGHFDADGNYFLNRDAQIRDSWLDNIDWVWPRVDLAGGLEADSAGLRPRSRFVGDNTPPPVFLS